jgi:hypothetical protein
MEIEKQEVKFWCILGATAFVGIGLFIGVNYLPSAWTLRRSLGLSVGEALVVAAVLGFTVDRYIKAFLVRKASVDLFKYLVGYKLPEEIQNRLRDLMGTYLIRKNYQVVYTLTPESDNQMLLDVRYSFLLQNISTVTISSYEPRVETEKHDNPRILELRCDEKDSHFWKVADAGGTIGTESSTVPGVIVGIGEKIDLVPQRLYPISGHYQLRVPSNHSETLSFLHPTVDVTVRVECPDDFQVVIDGAAVKTPKMWQFGGHAFLTSEHVRIRWFKTVESSAAPQVP